jgi:16S rRNA (guanine527-N7)-methyltransferase
MLAEAGVFGPEQFATATGVSRETLARLKLYASLLADWNQRHNLVSKASLDDLWRRHFLDSAQLITLIPETAASLIDLGSGAGFPGLVLAEMLRERPDFRAVLYESTGKKADFLRTVAERLTLANLVVKQARLESAPSEPFDLIRARPARRLDRSLVMHTGFGGRARQASS